MAQVVTDKDRAMEQLRSTLASPGWQAVIEPSLRDQIINKVNVLTSPKRPDGISDDFLRGQIDMLKYAVGAFRQKLAEYDAERMAQTPLEPPAKGDPYAPDDSPVNQTGQ